MADGVPSVLVIVDGDRKYPTVIGPSVIMKYLVVIVHAIIVLSENRNTCVNT